MRRLVAAIPLLFIATVSAALIGCSSQDNGKSIDRSALCQLAQEQAEEGVNRLREAVSGVEEPLAWREGLADTKDLAVADRLELEKRLLTLPSWTQHEDAVSRARADCLYGAALERSAQRLQLLLDETTPIETASCIGFGSLLDAASVRKAQEKLAAHIATSESRWKKFRATCSAK